MKVQRQTYQYSNSKHRQLTVESIGENRIIVHLVVWTRQANEFVSIKSCQTIEKSAELPHMENIARNTDEPSNTNNLWITIQLWLVQARKCMQQQIFQIPAIRLVFRVL